MKECPFCAESIQDEAIKCRYCGSALQASEQELPPVKASEPDAGPTTAMPVYDPLRASVTPKTLVGVLLLASGLWMLASSTATPIGALLVFVGSGLAAFGWIPGGAFALLCYLVLPGMFGASSPPARPPSPATETGAVTAASAPWAKLAATQENTPRPSAETLRRFDSAFRVLERYCPDDPNRLADFVVVGQRRLGEAGLRVLYVDVAEGVAKMLWDAAATQAMTQTSSCAEQFALWVTLQKSQ